jgi:hypothetical protein
MIEWGTVDKHVTAEDTSIETLSKSVEKSSLTSTRLTHEGSQSTWLNITHNVVQKTSAFTARNIDIVVNILPGENILRLDKGIHLLRSFITLTGNLNSSCWFTFDILDSLSGLKSLLDRVWGVSLSEDQELALRWGWWVEFGSDGVNNQKEDPESDDDTKVSPEVRVVVVESSSQVIVTANFQASRSSTSNGTCSLTRTSVGESRAVRDNRVHGTVGHTSMELVCHESFKGVEQRIDVGDPFEPRMHRGLWNIVTSIDCQS